MLKNLLKEVGATQRSECAATMAHDHNNGIVEIIRVLTQWVTRAWDGELLSKHAQEFVTADYLDEKLWESFLKIGRELLSKPKRHFTAGQKNADTPSVDSRLLVNFGLQATAQTS